MLLEITWVDGQGNIHVSPRNSTAGRALVGGLGLAGVVTELLFQLQGPSHTKLTTRFKQSDINLYQDVKAMLKVRGGPSLSSSAVVASVIHVYC